MFHSPQAWTSLENSRNLTQTQSSPGHGVMYFSLPRPSSKGQGNIVPLAILGVGEGWKVYEAN